MKDGPTNRPWGVILIGITEVLKGCAGMAAFSLMRLFETNLTLFTVLMIICALKIIIGIGLLRFREWAREAMVTLMSLLIIAMGISFFYCLWSPWMTRLIISGSFLALLFIYYLSRPHVKQHF